MRLTGRVDDPAIVAAMATVCTRAAEVGMPVGGFVAGAADTGPYITDDYVLLAVSTDMMMLARAAHQIIDTLKK
jgi:2-keto-3-deoxy-L-rhamnonate aldolase RhmA